MLTDAQKARYDQKNWICVTPEEENEFEATVRGENNETRPRLVVRMSQYSDTVKTEKCSGSSYDLLFPRWDHSMEINSQRPEIDRQISLMLEEIDEHYGPPVLGASSHDFTEDSSSFDHFNVGEEEPQEGRSPSMPSEGQNSVNACAGEGSYKFVCELQVPFSWWEEHYIPGRSKFAPTWSHLLEAQFPPEELGPGVECKLGRRRMSNYIPKPKSHRAGPNKKPKDAWTGFAECSSSSCSRRYIFAVPQADDNGGFLTVRLFAEGTYGSHDAVAVQPQAFEQFLSDIPIPSRWWEEHYREGKRTLKPGWIGEIARHFTHELRRTGVSCYCSLLADWNTVSKNGWRGEAYCGGKPFCSRRYKFELRLSLSGQHNLNVLASGQHCHDQQHVTSRPLSQSEKERCYEKLKAGVKPAQLSIALKEQKAATEQGLEALEHGNHDGAPSASICRRLRREVLAEGDLADDPYEDLSKACSALDEKYCNRDRTKKTVFMLSERSFRVAFSSPNMLEAMKSVASQQTVPIGYVDCTGGILSKVSWSEGTNYVYVIVMKVKGLAPIPVSEFISGSHFQYDIDYWLRNFTKHSGSPKLPFKVWVCDMSRAITNAVLDACCGMSSLNAYLRACLQTKEAGKTPSFPLVVWCYAHFLQANIRKLGELLPKADCYRKIKRLYKHAMAYLARTEDLNTARSFLTHLVFLCESETYTPMVDGALKEIGLAFGADVEEVTIMSDWVLYEDDRFLIAAVDESESTPAEEAVPIPIGLPEEDRTHETYQDSPFYSLFQEIIDEVRRELRQPDVVAMSGTYSPNPWRVEGYIDYLGKTHLAFYPMWSLYVLRCRIPDAENPLTNFAVELRFKLVKGEDWVRDLGNRPSRYVTSAVQSAERTILSLRFPDRPRGYRRREDPEEDDPRLPEQQATVAAAAAPADPPFEVWQKKSHSRRPPGGHYSKAEGAKFGLKLVEKSGEALKQQPPQQQLARLVPPDVSEPLYPKEVAMTWGKSYGNGAGLENLGNTCYINAILQVLFHIPSFVEWLTKERNCHSYPCVLCILHSLVDTHYNSSKVRPQELVDQTDTIFGRKSRGIQEDAHEFLKHLGQQVVSDFMRHHGHTPSMLDDTRASTTAWHQIFQGFTRKIATCTRCKKESQELSPFQELIMDVKFKTLQAVVNGYFKSEILEGVDCSCKKTKEKGVKKRAVISVVRPPKILCIQLKRFDNGGNKIKKDVTVPTILQLDSKFQYKVVGVVYHIGEEKDSGHYTAAVKCASQHFFYYDDVTVKPITWKAASILSSAYLIFYSLDQQ